MSAIPRGLRSPAAFVLTQCIFEAWTVPIEPIAPQRAMAWKDVKKNSLNTTLPMICGTAPLPKSLRGIFWLTHQGASSVLVSFGGMNEDGGNLNLGYLEGSDHAANIRLEGERTFTTVSPSITDRVTAFFVDAVYSFRFNSGTDPTYGQIYVRFLKPFDITFKLPAWISNYSMTLMGDQNRPHYSTSPLLEGPSSPYPGSVVWQRVTSFFGIDSGETYELVQVIDENFQPIEPAYSEMVSYEAHKNEVGEYAGWMFYRSVNPSPTAEGQELADDINKGMLWKWIWFWLLFTLAICCLCCCCCGLCWFCCCRRKKRRKAREVDLSSSSDEEDSEIAYSYDSFDSDIYDEESYEYLSHEHLDYPEPPLGYPPEHMVGERMRMGELI